ncbi:DUF1661 domain-containing protein [Porphyromonas gulae]|uniref:DUF1661 domain-containing protein n=1 Tax=Porphyromonas gulae TaxID=111105 RepID=UPI003742C9CA
MKNGCEAHLPLCPPFPAKGTKRIKGVTCGRNEFSIRKMLDCGSCFAENTRVNFFVLARDVKNLRTKTKKFTRHVF